MREHLLVKIDIHIRLVTVRSHDYLRESVWVPGRTIHDSLMGGRMQTVSEIHTQ